MTILHQVYIVITALLSSLLKTHLAITSANKIIPVVVVSQHGYGSFNSRMRHPHCLISSLSNLDKCSQCSILVWPSVGDDDA
jgi:hypothetical protein